LEPFGLIVLVVDLKEGTGMKIRLLVAAALTCLFAASASALPLRAVDTAPDIVLVRGGHGHGHAHGNRGRHLGWYIGRHRGWSHSRHRMH
jgi:hypothetical protein